MKGICEDFGWSWWTETVLTVQTHQHCVSLQLGNVDRIHLLISCGKKKYNLSNTFTTMQATINNNEVYFSQTHPYKHVSLYWFHDVHLYMLDLLDPISVNQEEQELRLMVSKRTTWPGSEPWLIATQTRGYSCSGTTSISNTFSGLGRGKSKCCHEKKESAERLVNRDVPKDSHL